MPSSPPGSARLPPLWLLVAVTAAGPLSLNIFVPSMPGIQQVFATDYGTVQLTLTLYLVGFAVAQLAYGPLSDRFGRRPTLLLGQAVFLAGTLLCLAAPSIAALIVGRVIQAFGACSGMVLARAIVRDVHDRDTSARLIAWIGMAMALAPMVAPSIGGFIDEFLGWRAVFAVVLAVAALTLAAAAGALHETLTDERRTSGLWEPFAGFGRLLRLRAFLGFALLVSFSGAVFFSFIGGAPYVMANLLGRPASEYGLYFIFVPLMFIVGSFVTSRLSGRVRSERLILVGLAVAVGGTLSLLAVVAAGALQPPTLFLPMMVFTFGNGMSMPHALAGVVSVDPRRAGAAAGLSGFMQMAVGAALSYAAGALLSESAMPLAAIMAASALAALFAHVLGNLVGRDGGGRRP